MKRLIAGLLILILLFTFVSCKKNDRDNTIPETEAKTEEQTEKQTEKKTEAQTIADFSTAGETETETEKETEKETQTETETEKATEKVKETETAPETKEAEEKISYSISFGHATDSRITEVNNATLSNKKSGLYDVLYSKGFTYSEVLSMIKTYSLPNNTYYGLNEATDTLKKSIEDARNLEPLESKAATSPDAVVTLKYGILTENASVRSFPTDLVANSKDSGNAQMDSIDYFQESMLPLGSGVLVLHEADGWSFVQGYNYYGWVKNDSIGLCNKEAFEEYLLQPFFVVSLSDNTYLNGKHLRIGTIIPYILSGNEKQFMIPERKPDGTLSVTLIKDNSLKIIDKNYAGVWTGDAVCSDGFLIYSEKSQVALMKAQEGLLYAWGDSEHGYDCSSTIGSVLKCFGVYMPRNTSAFCYFGGEVIDVTSGYDDSGKYLAMEIREGAILIVPGHALMYEKKARNGSGKLCHFVLHNARNIYDCNVKAGERERIYKFSLIESAFEELCTVSESYIAVVKYIISVFPCNNVIKK